MSKKPWQIYHLPRPKSEASTGPLSLVDFEIYSGLEVPKKAFFVRLDGWKFKHLARNLKLKKPFDFKFAQNLVLVATKFFLPFNPCLAYIFSDEINFLFLSPTAFRRIEKIDSIFAGLASAIFSQVVGQVAVFDARVIPVGKANIRKYLVWRQAEAIRNHHNAYAQWVLQKSGLSPRAVAKKLLGIKMRKLEKICYEKGVILAKTPLWQQRGIMVIKEIYEKEGYDPIKKKRVKVLRHRPKEIWEVPSFSKKEGKDFLENIYG